MSKEVVWVYGTSAAGKETFIRNAVKYGQAADRMGWADRVIVASPASLEYIAQSPDDPIKNKREEILTQVPQLIEHADVVLNKWQFVDTDADRPGRLLAALPQAIHRAVVLHPPLEELAERLPRKAWWAEYGEPGFAEQEVPKVAAALSALPEEFVIMHIQSGQHDGYKLMDFAAADLATYDIQHS